MRVPVQGRSLEPCSVTLVGSNAFKKHKYSLRPSREKQCDEEEDTRANQLLSEREAQLRTNDKTIQAKEKQNDSQRSQFKEMEEKEVELAKQKVESDYLVEQDEIEKLELDTAAMREREVAVKAEREKAMEANAAHDEEIEALEGQIAVYKEMCAEQGVALSSDDENAGA